MKYTRIYHILLFWAIGCSLLHAQSYRTDIFNPNIKTLRVIEADGDPLVRPVLNLNDDESLEISFDELSHDVHYYSYTVYHCNADWTLSDLTSSEYIQGFTTVDIDDYELSVNTTQTYTHYTFQVPNDDMRLTLSGNYVVCIYEDGDKYNPIAQVCFSIVEQRCGIDAAATGNTDIELNGRYQQLNIELNFNERITDSRNEIKLLVKQNNRTDNQAFDVKPNFIENTSLKYLNNKNLIFEGGYEYRRFDISSVYLLGEGVDDIKYDNTYYQAFLDVPVNNLGRAYSTEFDVNGQFVINVENSDYDDTEADYMWVHFFLPMEKPFFDGLMYVGGDFNFNLMDERSRMNYDFENKCYTYSAFLKQGGYNYQYWFLKKGTQKATLMRTENSYWQTGNEYAIYVYYRPFGQRYDALIGFSSFVSNQ